jgi:hypothetical protein
VQHYWDWFAQCEIDLYVGERAAAWRRVQQRWRGYIRSALHFNQAILIESLYLRARAALAVLEEGGSAPEEWGARKLLHQAERDARRIERQGTAWGDALAQLLRAGVAASTGDTASAITRASSAEEDLQGLAMNLHAAAAGRRRGELVGGEEGEALIEASDAFMAEQGIKDPPRITAMLAPGSWC